MGDTAVAWRPGEPKEMTPCSDLSGQIPLGSECFAATKGLPNEAERWLALSRWPAPTINGADR